MGAMHDGLAADAFDRVYTDRLLVARILSYFRGVRGPMAVVAMVITAKAAVDIALPVLLALGIDALGASRSTAWIVLLVALTLVAGGISWLCNHRRQVLTARSVGAVVLRLRLDAMDAVLARDRSFYDQNASGKIVSRVVADSESLASVITLSLDLLSQVALVALMAVVLLRVDAGLALLTLAFMPAVVLLTVAFRRFGRLVTSRSRRGMALAAAAVQETLAGMAVAKGFRRERRLYDEFRTVNDVTYRANLREGFAFSVVYPALLLLAGLSMATNLYFGGRAVQAGAISAGTWFLFMRSVQVFWLPMTSITSFWSQFQQGLAAAERVFALIDDQPDVIQLHRQPVGALRGKVEFEDVSFAYPGGGRVLERFSLTVEAGETLALVGETGAGKSTLVRLVARLYEPQAGRILVDGRDVRMLDVGDYRRRIGFVPQSPFLFAGTVADNMRYAVPGATDADVVAAACAIGGGDWLEALADGVATRVGEGGGGLSFGQRQLVALVRVLLQDPVLVVLDEATAGVDPLTEAEIQEGMALVLRSRTAIVIAHRLSTIVRADRIIVLDRGRIVEEGTHAALLQCGGQYAHLYDTYFRHQAPDYEPGP